MEEAAVPLRESGTLEAVVEHCSLGGRESGNLVAVAVAAAVVAVVEVVLRPRAAYPA